MKELAASQKQNINLSKPSRLYGIGHICVSEISAWSVWFKIISRFSYSVLTAPSPLLSSSFISSRHRLQSGAPAGTC